MFYIVYPGGRKNELAIIELSDSNSYELADYSVASRREFTELQSCVAYARELANKHGLTLGSSSQEIQKEINYLD